jgi:hypothetical protein
MYIATHHLRTIRPLGSPGVARSGKVRAFPVHPQFLQTYAEHVCPLKQTTLVRDHLGISCLDDLVVPPILDQVEITDIANGAPPTIRGLVMHLLINGQMDKVAFLLQNAEIIEVTHTLFQEAMRVEDR